MRTIFVLTASLLLILSGCANSPKKQTSVILQHPETMEVMECPLGEVCIGIFEEMGYVRQEQPTQEQ